MSGAASANQDEELALAGANALMNAPQDLESRSMSSDAKSPTFVDANSSPRRSPKVCRWLETAGYKVNASRRAEPGQAEIHTLDTDVIYVVEGTATLCHRRQGGRCRR